MGKFGFEELVKATGYPAELLEEVGLKYLAENAPEVFKEWVDESLSKFERQILDRKTSELIWVACCAVNNSALGLKLHAIGALNAGATKEEIIHALQLASLVGSHSILGSGGVGVLKEILT